MMDRRAFLSVVGGSILAAPLAVEAQLPTNTARIGVLSLAEGPNPIFMDLFRGLRELGWVDSKNMAVELEGQHSLENCNGKFEVSVRVHRELLVRDFRPTNPWLLLVRADEIIHP